jgi:menaquinone-specific isochorismate synthase
MMPFKEYGLEEAKLELLSRLEKETTGGPVPASFPVVVRVKVPLIKIDPLSWVAGQKNPRKVFWNSSGGDLAVAGVGAAFEAAIEGWYGLNDAWNQVTECMEACPEARLFAGMSFARTVTGAEWKGFPAMRFILPAVEVVKDKDGYWLVANAVRGRDGEPFSRETKETLEKMLVMQQVMPEELLPVSREDVPDYEDWVCSAEAVLESLEKEGLEKVVLARRVSFELKGALAGEMVLQELMEKQKADFAFLFSFEGSSFLGMSSEPLYVRDGLKVESRAVAGGRPRGKDKAHDDVLRDSLLKSDKDIAEHRLVAGALIEVFREFCRSYQVDCEREVLRQMHHQCLVMRLSGVLSEGVTDKEFLQALHPAPVVCGVPAEKARLFLQQYEVFDRGWFCGPVGFFSKTRTELGIAARGCLIETSKFHAYALAPFVQDSDPLFQWEEAAGEMKNILNVVHGARG